MIINSFSRIIISFVGCVALSLHTSEKKLDVPAKPSWLTEQQYDHFACIIKSDAQKYLYKAGYLVINSTLGAECAQMISRGYVTSGVFFGLDRIRRAWPIHDKQKMYDEALGGKKAEEIGKKERHLWHAFIEAPEDDPVRDAVWNLYTLSRFVCNDVIQDVSTHVEFNPYTYFTTRSDEKYVMVSKNKEQKKSCSIVLADCYQRRDECADPAIQLQASSLLYWVKADCLVPTENLAWSPRLWSEESSTVAKIDQGRKKRSRQK